MRYRNLITALATFLILPVAASAQTLKAGTWTGTAQPPGEGTIALTFDVKVSGDTTSITLTAGEHGTFRLEEVKVTSDKVTFRFTPGPTVNCSLAKREDGSYAGTCDDGSGESVTMTMIPPKQQLPLPGHLDQRPPLAWQN